MDILCIDKTGTITENNISIGNVIAFKGYSAQDVLLYATLCSRKEDLDPIDIAILSKAETDKKCLEDLKLYSIEKYIPFDPISKYAQSEIYEQKKLAFSVAKGAPQVIYNMVNDVKIKLMINNQVEIFAKQGQRALGIAIFRGKKWEYVGMISLYDPPRADSAETLKNAQDMGVHVKIITGDHKAVTQDIAQKIHLGTNIISVSEIKHGTDYVYSALENADGISEVYPEHKYTIVKLFQDNNHIVGMTGDGVNDAPALKKANCGIAVANSTDAAKASADMVLTKPGVSVIIDAMQESRNIFQRMNNYAVYRIAETIRLMLFITASILIFGFYPISAVMIVLLVILNDIPILAIAYDNVRPSLKPVRWRLKNVLHMATFLGVIGVFSSFLMLYLGYYVIHIDMQTLQTIIFLKLAIAGHLMVFTARTRGHFWGIKPAKSLLFATLGTQIVATCIAVYGIFVTPIGWTLAILVWLYAILFFLITNALKVTFYKKLEE